MKKILVLAGGSSSEREVSVRSGKRVASALCSLGIKTAIADPTDEIDLTREHFFFDFCELEKHSPFFKKANTEAHPPRADTLITQSVLSLCEMADTVFISLHGGIGENGKLQAVFDCRGIKYVGSDHEGSVCAMNKLLSKRIFESVGIPTPPYTVYKREAFTQTPPHTVYKNEAFTQTPPHTVYKNEAFTQTPPHTVYKNEAFAPTPPRFPCVVKPASEGSSVGVSIAKNRKELERAIGVALKSCDTVLLEAQIKGREITVGLLDDTPLAVTEIITREGFYDYENKYTEGKTEEITPAKISDELTEKAMRIAKRTHTALGLSNFSRIDMIIEKDTERIYVLEANTIPGMTCTSLLPLMAEYRGIGFSELCKRMAKIEDTEI